MSTSMSRAKKDVFGILWSGTGLVLTLSLASYNPQDPSFNSIGAHSVTHNLCGYFGSFLSDLLLQIFGLASWLIVLAVFRMAYKAFKNEQSFPKWPNLGLLFVALLNASSLLGLHLSQTTYYSGQIRAGGVAGHVLSQALSGVFNTSGVAIILWSLTLVFAVFYTGQPLTALFPWKDFQSKLVNSCKSLWQKWKQTASAVKLVTTSTKGPTFKPILQEEMIEAKESEEVETEPLFLIDSPSEERTEEKRKKREAVIKKTQKRRVENWELPKISMIENSPTGSFRVDKALISRNTKILEEKLAQFNVNGTVVAVKPGPAVTMYEFRPNADVKISKITELADDLSLALSAESVRIIAPLPSRDVVGIETSNPKREMVYLREVLEDPVFWDEKTKLPVVLGKQANGETKVVDLRKMPHLLVAGTTGSGKSVFVVSTITGLLFKHSPQTLKLILIDPKQVDLAAFHNVPHLLMPPIRDPKKAVTALKWAIREMEKRYRSMSLFGARGLENFNETVGQLNSSQVEEHRLRTAEIETSAPHENYYYTTQPYIVVVVEEFGDLMAVDKNNVEHCVVRLAQMARACGIHLILAMQSPRRDVITGLIKTNIPGRISFKVASKMDSRIILDESGAERLLAQGDMLFLAPGVAKPERHHGAWLPEPEILGVSAFWSKQSGPDYDRGAVKMLEGSGGGEGMDGPSFGSSSEEYDEMYDEILSYVSSQKEMSASLLQRKYRLGYPRAARLIEIFEKEGVVGPPNGSKPRQVLVTKL